MRVALVNNFFLPRTSGSSHLTDALARGLAEQGHDVLVVTSAQRAPEGEERRDGVRIVRLPCHELPKFKLGMRYDINFAGSPSNYRRLSRLLDDFSPDVVHQHGQFFDLTWMSAIWARRRGVPTLLTVHTALVQTRPLYSSILWLADQLMVRPFLAAGKPKVVVIDRFIDDYVRRRYKLPDDRIAWVPIGVEATRFSRTDRSEAKKRLGLGDRPVILSLGHVIPLRDRLALVEALPHIAEQHPDVAVVIVGDVCDDRCLRRADELGVREHLVVTGSVPRDDVPMYIAAADVEAHDLQGYGLGTASLEVMSAGVPVVSVVPTDNFPGISLRDGQHLVIVPPNDPQRLARAFIRVLDDEEFARQVGEGERELIGEYFTMDSVVDRYLKMYYEISDAGNAWQRRRTPSRTL